MSAYLMSPEDLATIALAYVEFLHSGISAERVFDDLLNENLLSLAARYPDAARISDWHDGGEAAYTFDTIIVPQHSATELDEIIRSYQYQSCEHDGWAESVARRGTDLLRGAIAEFVKNEQDAEAAKVQQRRAAIGKLPALYPKETAAAIRKLLKANFPATKFRVVTNRGSMVSSVRISWTDGPTTKLVDSLVGCFEAGKFDGMTDSYDYDRDSAISIDGQLYRPACRYVQTERNISASLANRCIKELAEYWGGIAEPLPVAVPRYDSFEIADGRGRERIRADLDHMHDWYSMIHQAAADRQRFMRAFRD